MKAQEKKPKHPNAVKVMEMMTKHIKKGSLSAERLDLFRKLAGMLAAIGTSPSWASFRKAAQVVVRDWGLGTASQFTNWLKVFSACLDVEVGVQSDKALARQQREFQRQMKNRDRLHDSGLARVLDLTQDRPSIVGEYKNGRLVMKKEDSK